ncbi:MAG: hypothetical protein ABSH28_11760 [Acidobacteriota bacterium]|jgi:beta-lactamase regulating signal transducer with metallopeptidase domain
MYEMLGICLSLTGLLIITSLASMLAAILWRLCSQAAASWVTAARARFLFFLRIAPGCAAILCVGVLFIPAYVFNEPRHTTEVVTAKLGLLAAVSLFGIVFAFWRGIEACLVTRRLVRDWLQHGEPVQIERVTIPAFRFQHRFPVIAIVGAMRPKLFIANQIFHSLTSEEISAAVAHESGHLSAADNFKRWLLRVCRNYLFIVPYGRSLERAWIESAELAADEHAAMGGASVALNLASALVKVARLVPRGSKPAMFAGASLVAPDLGSIRTRVLRLTQLASQSDSPRKANTRVSGLALGVCFSALMISAILIISSSGLLGAIHSALECVVSVLQ